MNVLFYDDGPVFGGHEIATITGIEYLLRTTDWTMTFAFAEANKRLGESLLAVRGTANDRLSLAPLPVVGESFQGLRSLLSPVAVGMVRKFAMSVKPDVIVVVQGNIELGSLGLLAFDKLGFPLLSYVPYAHTFQEVGVKGGAFRDQINKIFYAIPDRFVSLNQSIVDALRARGVKAPIDIAANGRSADEYVVRNRSAARSRYNIDRDRYVIGLFGRTMLRQKGHDILIDAVSKHKDKLGNPCLLFVGDGPDLESVKQMATNAGLGDDVQFVTWEMEMSYAYSALDALAIPSRFEGLPLVMIEAMHYSIPIVASNRDGMGDVLPDEWLFPTGDSDQLAERIAHVRGNDQSAHTSWFKKLATEQWTPENFGKQFAAAIVNTANMKKRARGQR